MFTSSLNNTLTSFLTGSISCNNPVENPTINGSESSVIAVELKSWHVGLIPLYNFLSMGLVKSAPCNNKKDYYIFNYIILFELHCCVPTLVKLYLYNCLSRLKSELKLRSRYLNIELLPTIMN